MGATGDGGHLPPLRDMGVGEVLRARRRLGRFRYLVALFEGRPPGGKASPVGRRPAPPCLRVAPPAPGVFARGRRALVPPECRAADSGRLVTAGGAGTRGRRMQG